MKNANTKTMLAIVGAAILGTAALLTPPTPTAAFAFERVQGQDKTGKNCERVDGPESSTFGKCENVCKDKDITRDAENNRWVCKASKVIVNRPPIERFPGGGKLQQASPDAPPNKHAGSATKAGKAKNK